MTGRASYWTGPGRGWLAELDLPAASREIITDCLAVIDGLAPLIDRIDGELHQHAKADPRVKVLRTLPGVGEFTALVMVAEIGDISRFPSARKLASWAGLTPTVRGSDLKVRHGNISKQGSVWLRWVMNQAAQTAKRSPEFAATYSSIAKRRGKKIATIAIARKLLTRAWHLLPRCRPPMPARRRGGHEDGRVAKPRVSSFFGMSPAPSAALDLMTEQPGPGHMVMAAARTWRGAGWVLVRPLRPPAPGTSTRPLTIQPQPAPSSPSMIFRRLPASSSFVLAAARLRALQLDPGRAAGGPGSCEEGSRRTVGPARRRA